MVGSPWPPTPLVACGWRPCGAPQGYRSTEPYRPGLRVKQTQPAAPGPCLKVAKVVPPAGGGGMDFREN